MSVYVNNCVSFCLFAITTVKYLSNMKLHAIDPGNIYINVRGYIRVECVSFFDLFKDILYVCIYIYMI